MRYYTFISTTSALNERLAYYCDENGWQLHSVVMRDFYHDVLVVLQRTK